MLAIHVGGHGMPAHDMTHRTLNRLRAVGLLTVGLAAAAVVGGHKIRFHDAAAPFMTGETMKFNPPGNTAANTARRGQTDISREIGAIALADAGRASRDVQAAYAPPPRFAASPSPLKSNDSEYPWDLTGGLARDALIGAENRLTDGSR